MKTIRLLVLLLLIGGNVHPCSCLLRSDEPLSLTISRYDFIAHIKVKSARAGLAARQEGSDFAQIEIIELFKGNKIDSLHIWGIGSSCDMGVTSGDEWLIFGHRTDSGYSTGMCTNSYRITPHSSWQFDSPFITEFLYKLQKLYHHPIPVLPDGTHKELLPDGTIKNQYTVVNGKLEGDYYYRSAQGHVYFYSFRNGEHQGDAYHFGPGAKWFDINRYVDGKQTEFIEYKFPDPVSLQPNLLSKTGIDSFINQPKQLILHRQYFPDQSQLSKIWDKEHDYYTIEQKDSTGKILFSISYFENGSVSGSSILDPNTGIETFTGYYENGGIERKLISYPGNKREEFYYNNDGSLKKEIKRENNKITYSKEY